MLGELRMGVPKSNAADRRFFRIKYPENQRPDFISNGSRHQLVDVSEAGLKYLVTNSIFPPVGQPFVATLLFKTGLTVTVKGHVVRTDHKHVMIRLDKGIPKEALKAEADLLLEKFGLVPTDHY